MAKVALTGQSSSLIHHLAPGKYVAEIVGWQFGFSGNGNEMLTVIIDCCASKSGSGPKGRIYDRLVFTSNAAWKIEQFIECFAASAGLNVKIGDEVEIDERTMERAFHNAKGGVMIGEETYNDKNRNVVETYVASKDIGVFPKGDTPRVLTRDQKDSTPSSPAPSGPSGGNSYAPAVDDDDDIPF